MERRIDQITDRSVILPVVYTEKFYAEVLLPSTEDYCKLSEFVSFLECHPLTIKIVYFNDIPVGAVCSRIETNDSTKESRLYIMTMGILAVRVIDHDFAFH